jgi:hypothetical protein
MKAIGFNAETVQVKETLGGFVWSVSESSRSAVQELEVPSLGFGWSGQNTVTVHSFWFINANSK